jgi:hypothetical protein
MARVPKTISERLLERTKARPTPFRLVRAGRDELPFKNVAARDVPIFVPVPHHRYSALLPGLRMAIRGRRYVTRYF